MHTVRNYLLVLPGGLLLVVGCRQAAEPEAIVDMATPRLVATANQALENEEFDRALALADRAARRAPRAVEPFFLKGLIYSRTLRWEEAERVFARRTAENTPHRPLEGALAQRPGVVVFYTLRPSGPSREACRGALHRNRCTLSYTQAEQAYRHVIERDPDFPGVWNTMGNNAVWQGAYQKARSFYYNEVAVAPAPSPWSAIGRIYRELGVIDSAAYAFREAIALDSSYIPAYLSYARLMEDEGEYERALALTEEAAARKPGTPEVQYRMGSLLARVGQEEEAVSYLQVVTQT